MMRHQEALGAIVLKDPAVAHVAMAIGGARQPAQQRPHVHHAEAARPARRHRRPGHRAAAAAARQGRGRAAVPAGGAGRARRRPRRRARSTSTRCRTPTSTSSTNGRRRCSPSCRRLPELRDVATDQQTQRHDADADDRPRPGVALRPDRRRRSTTRSTTPSASARSRNISRSYQLRRDHGGAAERCRSDLATLDKIFVKSPTTGGEVPLSAFAKWTTTPIQPLSISHQGQFPAIDDQLQSGAGRGARPGDRRDPARRGRAEAARRR